MWFGFLIFGLLVGLVGLVAMIGAVLPKQHEASGSAEFATKADALWDLAIALQDESGVNAESITDKRPQRRVSRVIEAPGARFGGTWTLQFEPVATGTRLTITERGHVYNPVYRFFGKYVVGHEATLQAFLKTLQTRVQQAG